MRLFKCLDPCLCLGSPFEEALLRIVQVKRQTEAESRIRLIQVGASIFLYAPDLEYLKEGCVVKQARG